MLFKEVVGKQRQTLNRRLSDLSLECCLSMHCPPPPNKDFGSGKLPQIALFLWLTKCDQFQKEVKSFVQDPMNCFLSKSTLTKNPL